MDVSSGGESAFQPGSIVAERYQVHQVLGAGSMGTVLRATDLHLENEPVALKLLYPHLVSDSVTFSRFRNEILIARKLSHPNIVRLYDFGNAGGGYYFLSMELVSGTSLRTRIQDPRYPQLGFDEVVRILYEIGLGVAHAHRQGVIHRDLKPDNILISDRNEIRITDFGLARQLTVDKGFTASGETVGTPCYMAPEQICGDKLDGRADIYSLGIMAYEMVAGEKPFDNDNWLTLANMHMRQELPEFPEELGIPRWFTDFVHTCAAKRKEDRFPSAEVFCAELRKHLGVAPTDSASPAVFSQYLSQVTVKTRLRRMQRKLIKRAIVGATLAALSIVLPVLIGRQSFSVQRQVLKATSALERSTGISLGGVRRAFRVDIQASDATLASAISQGDARALSLLLAAGGNPAVVDSNGRALLHLAAEKPGVDLTRLLLDAGASPNVAAKDGVTPLIAAVAADRADNAALLLDAGAQPDALDVQKRTPLMHAAAVGSVDSVQQLLRFHPFVHAKDADGTPVIAYAVTGGSLPVLQRVIDAGAKVNDTSSDGTTPLMQAVKAKRGDMVELLMSKGASPSLTTRRGETARDFANAEMRKLLNAGKAAPVEQTAASSNMIRSAGNVIVATQKGTAPAEQTRLRIVSGPQGRWATGKITKLLRVDVGVRNAGDVSANDVRLVARVPGGYEVPLNGPSEIGSNETAKYSVDIEPQHQLVPGAGEIKIMLTCENCRR